MPDQVFLQNQNVYHLAMIIANHLKKHKVRKIYPIPRGGIPAAYAIQAAYQENGGYPLTIVANPKDADAFVDDIIDSGATMEQWCDKYPGKPFYALVDRTEDPQTTPHGWVIFPWEAKPGQGKEVDFAHTITRLLQQIGEDPNREGLLETPARVAKAWDFWCGGYEESAEDIFKVFEDGAENYDEMVIVKDIPFYSHCEHHMAAIFGTATIGYIPNGKIVGLSKLSRLLDMYSRRLQVQERLTNQIADAIEEHLGPLGVGVVIKARHLCMESRGICKQGHHTITSSLRGVMKEQDNTRAEFMSLV